MSNKLILTAAVTGAVHVSSMSPYLPITPEEIIRQSVDACRAGAAAVHIHARDPETGEPSSDLGVMRQIVSGIKERCDVIICITTGASQMMTVEERLSVIPALKPELASCNAGSMNFVLAGLVPQLLPDGPAWERRYLGGTYDNVFSNTYLGLETYIKTMAENGTIPEFEVYDAGMINNIAYFRKKGVLTCPIYIQFVLGIQGGVESHHAGTGDGAGGQALVAVGVVGTVHRLIVLLGYGPSCGVDQGCINLQKPHRLIIRIV